MYTLYYTLFKTCLVVYDTLSMELLEVKSCVFDEISSIAIFVPNVCLKTESGNLLMVA
jgi:hypothetical protein